MSRQMFSGATLDSLLDELTDLALTSPNSSTFFQSILNAAVNATDAIAGAIWSVREVNYRLEAEVGLVQLGIGNDSQLQLMHEEALEFATKGQVRGGPEASAKRICKNSEYRFFGCRDKDLAYLVIELVHKDGVIATVDEDSIGRFMAALSEIARDFRNAQLLQNLQAEDLLWSDFKRILPKLHSSIRLDTTSYHLANEGRTFLQCDRLSVLQIENGKTSTLAVSGVATIEKRAKQVRTLESLVAVVARRGVSFQYPSSQLEAPQLSDALQKYLDASRTEWIWILLINKSVPSLESQANSGVQTIGALVIENFAIKETSHLEHRCELLHEHATVAFRNAIQYNNMLFRRLSESLQKWAFLLRANRVKLAVGVAGALCGICLAMVIPAELNIDATGTIQPVTIRHLYAPANGEVVKVYFAHQSEVETGAVLMDIRSRELELRKEELLTLHASAQEKLRGIEMSRLQNRKTNTSEALGPFELSASESELREVVSSQKEQLSVLNEMLATLQLRSPIKGRVISWEQAEALERRPVQIGQKLISIAELDGEGKLQLRVLDEDTRHVINASRNAPEGLRVSFSLASDPGTKRSATVTQIGTTIESLPEQAATLRLDAAVAAAEMVDVRPGATANARIHCGRSSIGYVWTRRLWDFICFQLL
jgi:multidrug efflux pump subunit AcrA (membrane-fusion protein)